MNKEKIVYVVHAIDTEGPLYESIKATFERLKDIFNIRLEATSENLEKLRNKEINLDGKENLVAKFIDPFLLRYNDTWDKIDQMLSVILSKQFRNKMSDSFGGGWVYNWHCMDHIGYEINPRGKDVGYHNIHDRYVDFLEKYDSSNIDDIQWHFHPMSMYSESNRNATSYENSPSLHQVLCRRILERNFFPAVFRAGFHTERPDSHWFLEQWIPFDCSNLAVDNPEEFELHNDFQNGRFFDWRRAPLDWSVYNPGYYDYQVPGNCRRYIARFLQINTRMANLTQEETDKAFRNTKKGIKVILGVTNHDFRDIAPDVNIVRNLIANSAKKFPKVKYKFCKAKEAFNEVVHDGNYEKLELNVNLFRENNVFKLKITTKKSMVFGPQPYLAIKTKSGRFIHDNLGFGLDGRSWFYMFDVQTILSTDLDMVGVAANNKYGDTFIKTFTISDNYEVVDGQKKILG